MKNKLGFLGFVSLLGFLGLLTDNRGFLGFFGFAVYFRYFKVLPDELFWATTLKSAAAAFFAGMTVTVLATAVSALISGADRALAVGCGLGFAVSVMVFALVHTWYELREGWGLEE